MAGRKPNPKSVAPSSNWTIDDGISQSLLNRFMGCRERFRLYAVEGLREFGTKTAMDFGSAFHDLLEIASKHPHKTPEAVITHYRRSKKSKRVSLQDKDMLLCFLLFERYCWFFSETTYRYLDQEAVFRVPYKIRGYRSVDLRGRFDGIIQRDDGSIWIEEHKTKGQVNTDQLDATIPYNLQTMLYAVAAEKHYKRPVSGIVYNVIRVPGQKQGKNETVMELLERIDEEIIKNPKYYFYRWQLPIDRAHMDRWKRMTFDPLIISVIQWWESVKNDPFSPWEIENDQGEAVPNPHHWQRPFGVYDSLTNGVGDYFNLLTRNVSVGITKDNKPFQELL